MIKAFCKYLWNYINNPYICENMLIMIRTNIVNIIILVIFLIGSQSCWLCGPSDDGCDSYDYMYYVYDQYCKCLGVGLESDTIFIGSDANNAFYNDFVLRRHPPISNGYFPPFDTIAIYKVNDTTFIDYCDTLEINHSLLNGESYCIDLDSLKNCGYKEIVYYTHWKEWIENH